MKLRSRLLSIGLSLSLILSGVPVSAEEEYEIGGAEICLEETPDGSDAVNENEAVLTDAIVDLEEDRVAGESETEGAALYAQSGETEEFTVDSVEVVGLSLNDEVAVHNEGTTETSVATVTVYGTDNNAVTTPYSDISDAINGWIKQSNSKLTLLEDVVAPTSIVIGTTGMTLDLKGHTISRKGCVVKVNADAGLTITDTSTGKKGQIKKTDSNEYTIFSQGTLTIQDGTITSASENNATVLVGRGTLSVTGGTIKNTGNNYAINIQSDSKSVDIRGGEISSTGHYGIYNNGKLMVSDGTIQGETCAIYNLGNLNVSDGKIQGKKYGICTDGGRITISGSPGIEAEKELAYSDGIIDLSESDPVNWAVYVNYELGMYTLDMKVGYPNTENCNLILPTECYGVYVNDTKAETVSSGSTGTILYANHDWQFSAEGTSLVCVCANSGCKAGSQKITLTEPKNLVYDGQVKEAVLEGTTDVFTTTPEITYCCEGGCVHAGKHTAKITAEGVTASMDFTIAKAEPAYQKPTGLKAMAGDTLGQIPLPEGFAWTDPTQSAGEAGNRTFTLIYTPEDTANYNVVTGIEVSVEVSAKPQETETEKETDAGTGADTPHIHTYGTWKTTSKATVFAAEAQTRTCSCGETETRTVGEKLTAVLELPGKLTSLSMKKGVSKTIAVTMANGDSVKSVKSAKTSVLKAALNTKTGKITLKAVKAGTAKVTIKLASGKSRTYTVKVVTGTIKTTGISASSVTNKKLTLAKGKTHTLKIEVKPFTSTQKVTYTSSNKKAATVTSAGKIKAVAAGKATITAKSGSKSVKITVTVPGITISKTSVSVKKGKTLNLSPKTYGISSKVTYTSSNKKVVTVTSKGKVKGIKKGTAKITIQAGSYKKTVTVKVK